MKEEAYKKYKEFEAKIRECNRKIEELKKEKEELKRQEELNQMNQLQTTGGLIQ
jgi:TolA-binding protein